MSHNDPFYIRTPEEFKRDISYQSEPLHSLIVYDNQYDKVDKDGRLATFVGDTVIFELDSDTCKTIGQMRDELYRRCGDLLCEPLPDESFHITLHDLFSSKTAAWNDLHAVFSGLESRAENAENILKRFRETYREPIHLKPTYRYNAAQIRKKIERQKSKHGWEFIFLGANIDAIETAEHIGIAKNRSVNYHCDSRGTRLNYEVIGDAVGYVRETSTFPPDRARAIEEDFKSR